MKKTIIKIIKSIDAGMFLIMFGGVVGIPLFYLYWVVPQNSMEQYIVFISAMLIMIVLSIVMFVDIRYDEDGNPVKR